MKKTIRGVLLAICCLLAMVLFAGCSGGNTVLRVVSGSENKELVEIIQAFEKTNHIRVEMTYKGSVEIMNDLQTGASGFDAVWPANSIWITMGDTQKLVRHQHSIMTTPVVFGIRESLAQSLGFTGKQVSIKDIQAAIQNKKLTFAMTSATQSNSGACAYLGFLNSLLGSPDVITLNDLKNEKLTSGIRTLLQGVNRSSGSSDWLKELFLSSNYDAMVNYEALIISTNQELVKQGRETLHVVYPYDGLSIADSPLGYINHGEDVKEKAFLKFQEYLLSADVQTRLNALGRRTGLGMTVANPDPKVFNPAWGIDTTRILSPIKMPSAEVIQAALNLYQSSFRKASATVYCLDFSGSMAGKGSEELKKAMRFILDQDNAAKFMLQATGKDKTVILPFDDTLWSSLSADGNNPNTMKQLLDQVDALSPNGGTDIYQPVLSALDTLSTLDSTQYAPAIILLTDGNSNSSFKFEDFEAAWQQKGLDIPVFSITFGDASMDQLSRIATLTHARVFDGTKDLSAAFKQAKGYN